LKLASFLIYIILIGSIVLVAGSSGATGVYDDFPSFFSSPDTVRVILLRESECDLGGRRASLLTGGFTARPAPRFEVRLELAFPALRSGGEVIYGVGDMRIRGAARLSGDSLNASGLYLRADLTIPTGSERFRPFSNGSFEADAGVEARVMRGGFALRGAALHTIAGEKTEEADFGNDTRLTLAASVGVPLPRIAAAEATAFFVRFDGGGTRTIFLLSLDRELSRQLVLEVAGAFETGPESSRVFDSSASVSFRYRFPPRFLTPRPDSIQP
jgi:hypothetical protein